MSLPSSKIVRIFINFAAFVFFSFAHIQVKAWDLDLSRRERDFKQSRLPATVEDAPGLSESPKMSLFEVTEPRQEIVILHTDSGFIPNSIALKKNGNYRLHVVNVSTTKKNASFILDSFSEHHATYFGEKKSFEINPKAEGVYSFLCPESAQQGQVVVLPEVNRATASAE